MFRDTDYTFVGQSVSMMSGYTYDTFCGATKAIDNVKPYGWSATTKEWYARGYSNEPTKNSIIKY